MSAARTKPSAADEAPASIPQTTPVGIGYGHPEYQFVQSIMEMQKSLGEINSSIKTLGSAIDSVKSKVDGLVEWKHMIVGGVVVLGIVFSVCGFFIAKFWDYVTIKAPAPPPQIPLQLQYDTPQTPPLPPQPKKAQK